jgi:hypothetical protein
MRAAGRPPLSIFHAACSTSSRAASISARLSAIQCWITCLSASGRPAPVRG